MSGELRLTEWLPGSWKPGLDGVYQRYFGPNDFQFARFASGRGWFRAMHSAEAAAAVDHISVRQCLAWRGLAEPPR